MNADKMLTNQKNRRLSALIGGFNNRSDPPTH
jgi:hypothetical protein